MIAAAVAGSLCLAGIVGAQAPSAATPATPNPGAAAPVQQTPIPAPGSAIPNPSASTTGPSAVTPASPAGSTTMQNPSLAASPIQMPSAVPNKAETAPSAFDKLATAGATSVSKQETDKLVGFDRAFSEAVRDKDGKLTKDEFNLAWAIYTGRT
jgi:hypothetical protein